MKHTLTDQPPVEETAITPTPAKTLAPTEQKHLGVHEGLDGEWDLSDIQFPKLNLVGKTSKLVSRENPAGVYLYDKSIQVGDGEKPFRLIVLSQAKEYWQKLPEGSTERPMVFKELREVREAGGSVEYGTTDLPFQRAARCLVLIESDTAQNGFDFEADGKFYAMAQWFLTGTAFTAAAMKFATDTAKRKPGAPKPFYEITAEIKSNTKASWYVPVVRITRDTAAPELIDQVKAAFA